MKISVKVKPAARDDSIVEKAGEFIVSTTARAYGGKANVDVCRIVAEHFGVSARRVRIIAGKTSRRKVLEVL